MVRFLGSGSPQQNSFLKGRGLSQAIVCANYYAKFDGSPIANKWVKGGWGLAGLEFERGGVYI